MWIHTHPHIKLESGKLHTHTHERERNPASPVSCQVNYFKKDKSHSLTVDNCLPAPFKQLWNNGLHIPLAGFSESEMIDETVVHYSFFFFFCNRYHTFLIDAFQSRSPSQDVVTFPSTSLSIPQPYRGILFLMELETLWTDVCLGYNKCWAYLLKIAMDQTVKRFYIRKRGQKVWCWCQLVVKCRGQGWLVLLWLSMAILYIHVCVVNMYGFVLNCWNYLSFILCSWNVKKWQKWQQKKNQQAYCSTSD